MTESEVLQQLNQILGELFDRPDLELDYNTSAEDIEEWDSASHIMLVVEVERQFKVKFHTAEVEEMKNVGDLVKLIMSKLEARA